MYSFSFTDTQTGETLLNLEDGEMPSSGSYGSRLNGFESGQHTFQLGSSDLSRADWRELTDPWRRTLDVDWDGQPVFSGLTMGYDWDRNSGALSVASAEVRTILARRHLFGIGGYAAGTRVLNSRSLRGLVLQLVYLATQGNYSSVWDLPFYFPTFDEVGPHNRTYWNYLFEDAEQAISEAQDTEGGPDVYFKRIKTGNTRKWEVQVGAPRLAGPMREFMLTGDEPNAFNVKETGDGTQMVTGVFAIGSGSEQDILHGEAATVAVPGGYPSLDVTRQFSNIDNVPQLDAMARSERDAFKAPTAQLSFDTLAGEFFPGGQPGSSVWAWSDGDLFIPDGWQQKYCIGVRGDMSEIISLDVQ